MSMIGGPNIVENGLSFYINTASDKSYPKTGASLNDLSIYKNNATLYGGYSYESVNGGCIALNGTSAYASVPSVNAISFPTEWTIECWVYRTGPSDSGGFSKLISKWGNYFLSIANTNGLDAAIYGAVGYGGSSHYTSAGADRNTNLPLNQWAQVAMSYSESDGFATVFLNARILHTITAAQTATSSTEFMIGKPNPDIENQYFDGKVSNVFLYNRKLEKAEILQNYNALKGRFRL